MKMPVRSSCTWKPTYTLARLMVGLHHSVKRRLGIWLSPERCAFVSFLYLFFGVGGASVSVWVSVRESEMACRVCE